MATIAEQLTSLANTKTAIKDAIVAKGVQVADDTPFRNYADKIGEISGGGEPVEKTKFGVGIDNFIGDVDAEGNYTKPSELFVFDLSGVKKTDNYNSFKYLFYGNTSLSMVIANDIISVGTDAFYYAFNSTDSSSFFYFDGLETVDGYQSFCRAFENIKNQECVFSFKKLKTISGNAAFQRAFNSYYITLVADDVFPALESISNSYALDNFIAYSEKNPITFSRVKKITGGTATYNSTFGSFYVKDTVWNFPSATEFTGYIWSASASYPGEIHFAAANQAAIEACDGYANKWGFTAATIYFDL